jgi:chemotaxis protein CheZ
MRQYIGFKLNDNEFTLPILKVREIVNTPAITRLPQSPEYVKGVINLRGSIIPVVDLKELVSMDSSERETTKTIVITNDEQVFGIMVDEITSVIKINEEDIEPAEGFLQENLDRVEGVAKFDDRLVILLDTSKLVDTQDLGAIGEGVMVEGEKAAPLEAPETRAIGGGAARPVPDGRARPLPERAPEAAPAETMARAETAPREGKLNEVKEALNEKYRDDESRREFARKVVELIEALAEHDFDRADNMIAEMLQASEDNLFKEIGMVTRKLHDSLKEFKNALDPRIKQIADEEVPTAVDSLEYVITKTQDAANKTMGIVEKYQKDLDGFSGQLAKIKNPKQAVVYLNEFKASLNKDLTEILLAQEFQDITGQTIRKVIELVNAIEAELVGLITTFGVKADARKKDIKIAQKISQDGVDDLLREFGF